MVEINAFLAKRDPGRTFAMKVAMFAAELPPYSGGIATYCFEVAAAATRAGHEVTVFAFCPDVENSDLFEVVPLRPHYLKVSNVPLATANMALQLGKRSFDVLVAVDLKNMIASSILPSRICKRAVVHGTDVKSKLTTKYLRHIKPYRNFERILTNSSFTRSLVLKHHPYVEDRKVVPAPLGVNDFWFQPPTRTEQSDLHQQVGDLTDRFVVVSVGRLEPRKGHLQTIAAIRALPSTYRNRVTYLIAGVAVDDRYARSVRDAASLADADIRLLGDIARGSLRALYAQANVLAHTIIRDDFRAEGFGLVVLEAAAAGVAPLVTRVDALPEVVGNGKIGLLTNEGDIGAIADCIQALMREDLEERRKRARQCQIYAREFSWHRCAEITLS